MTKELTREEVPDFPINEEEVTRIFQGCETDQGNVTLWSRQAIMARDALRYCLRARRAQDQAEAGQSKLVYDKATRTIKDRRTNAHDRRRPPSPRATAEQNPDPHALPDDNAEVEEAVREIKAEQAGPNEVEEMVKLLRGRAEHLLLASDPSALNDATIMAQAARLLEAQQKDAARGEDK
jgi:hypothetical protein